MDAIEMTLAEIARERERFLTSYHVADAFRKCKSSWEELLEIGKDFEAKRSPDGAYYKIIQRFIAEIAAFEDVHSYRFRIKKTGSLLAKVIRKSAEKEKKITVENYCQEITDLLGLRILYVFKEDYWPVHEQIMEHYRHLLAEDINLKIKEGDSEEAYSKLTKGYSNVKTVRGMYRSIHYTLYSSREQDSPKIEIQTRSVFEEGWSEINHKLAYKKGKLVDPSLGTASKILNELVGCCDSIGTLMKEIYDHGASETEQPTKDYLTSMAVRDVITRFLME